MRPSHWRPLTTSISASGSAAAISAAIARAAAAWRSEEHTSELQSQSNLVCRLLLEKKKGHDRRARFAQRGDQGFVGRLPAGPAGAADSGELRVLAVQVAGRPTGDIGARSVRRGPHA